MSLVAGSLFVRAVGFATSAVIIRAFGPREFGSFTVGLTLALLFALCVNAGLDDLLVREIARAPRNVGSLVGDAAMLRLPVLPVGLAAGLLIDSVIHSNGLYLFLAGYAATYTYLLLICAILRGRGRMRHQATLLSAHMGLIAVASIVATALTKDIVWIAAIYAASTALALICGYLLILRLGIRARFGWRPATWAHLARANLGFAITVVGVLILDREALVLLGLLRGQSDAGSFSSVYNLVLALSNLPIAAAAAALPHMARLAQRSSAQLGHLASKLLACTVMLSLPLAVVLSLSAPVLVPLLFGPEYQSSVRVLQLIAFASPALFLTVVLVSILEAADRQRTSATSVVQSLVVASPVMLLCVCLFGLEGASVGYVFAHVLLAAALLRQWLPIHRSSGRRSSATISSRWTAAKASMSVRWGVRPRKMLT